LEKPHPDVVEPDPLGAMQPVSMVEFPGLVIVSTVVTAPNPVPPKSTGLTKTTEAESEQSPPINSAQYTIFAAVVNLLPPFRAFRDA
jgi:hypothetical protein